MPNKETSRNPSSSHKPMPKKFKQKMTESGEFEIEGREHLGKDSEETDFEITGRESLISKKTDKHKKSKN